MDGKDAATSAPIYRPSAEITPAEYEYYMREAQQMRAEAAAEFFRTLGRAFRRLFARAERTPQRRAPVLAKSRTA
jgi:hypothetical protein